MSPTAFAEAGSRLYLRSVNINAIRGCCPSSLSLSSFVCRQNILSKGRCQAAVGFSCCPRRAAERTQCQGGSYSNSPPAFVSLSIFKLTFLSIVVLASRRPILSSALGTSLFGARLHRRSPRVRVMRSDKPFKS